MKSERRGAVEAFARILPRSFLQRAGVPARSFSGIRIRGLAVNRVENKREVPVFAADEAKNRGRTLELKNCRVFADDGSTNSVGTARLVVQPAPALVWNGGMRKLDDLLPNFSKEKKRNESEINLSCRPAVGSCAVQCVGAQLDHGEYDLQNQKR